MFFTWANFAQKPLNYTKCFISDTLSQEECKASRNKIKTNLNHCSGIIGCFGKMRENGQYSVNEGRPSVTTIIATDCARVLETRIVMHLHEYIMKLALARTGGLSYKEVCLMYSRLPVIYTNILGTTKNYIQIYKNMIQRESLISIDKLKLIRAGNEKGTVGILLDADDMPFNKHGLRPDIIVNPNAIPSRMTTAQLVECMIGKAAALLGRDADGTPFEDYDLKNIEDILKRLGYSEDGKEVLYNGMTGEAMKVKIFFGPTYYQRLKHLVSDKIHSRALGPKTSLTRQASEGRSRDGGLRLGEMEKDALIAHGLSKFLKEKLLDNSDAYVCYVCDICGLFAQRIKTRDTKHYPLETDIYKCIGCQNTNKISKVRIPYAFKLCIHELMALGIAPRIRCKKEEFN